jgi:hypothetical protein
MKNLYADRQVENGKRRKEIYLADSTNDEINIIMLFVRALSLFIFSGTAPDNYRDLYSYLSGR